MRLGKNIFSYWDNDTITFVYNTKFKTFVKTEVHKITLIKPEKIFSKPIYITQICLKIEIGQLSKLQRQTRLKGRANKPVAVTLA